MTGGGWEAFGAALADELIMLEYNAMVVVSDAARREYFTQFAQLGEQLRAEAVSNYVLEGRRLSPQAERVLAEAGWNFPVGRGVNANWWLELPWPARSARYRQVAAMAVVALRDAYRVPTPARLAYRAWINGTPREVPLPGLGIQRIGVHR